MATNPKDVPQHYYSLEEYFALEDASAACGELEFKHTKGHDALSDPVVVSEVSSPSTAALDEGPKFVAYQAIPTLRDYLLVSQDGPRVTHYARPVSGAREPRDGAGLDASLELESAGCALRLRDIYDGVTFPA